VLGRFDGGAMALEVVHRFANRPVRLPDGLHWDLLGLFAESLVGLEKAANLARLDGIGVDAWGVDYGLLDSGLRLLGPPFHYRDTRTVGMTDRAHARVDRRELYAVTGTQMMPINTVFQLLAEADAVAMSAAQRIALVPDLIALWLTGEIVNEITAASTTGLLDARSGGWAHELIERLGLPARPFSIEPVEPGLLLGPVLPEHAVLGGVPVWTVAGHDTAAAFVATPLSGRGGAVLSSGTWSLLGLELERPELGADAADFNITNERGLDGTTRLLRNVMGLWLLQECRRRWRDEGLPSDYAELHTLAGAARPDVALFDPDADALLAPGDMPARIVALCRESGQTAPNGPGELVRSILVSLACKYRFVLERLERIGGTRIELLHVVGGGSQSALLCQLTADLTRVPVLAGPAEATALGNALVQARAAGDIGDSLAQLREVAASSSRATSYEPGEAGEAHETYSRFLAATGLASSHRTAALT
jgi:rhamnulokinase